MPTDPTAGIKVMARLDDLAAFSAQPDALTRLYLTAEHRQAADLVRAWMTEAGMRAALDDAGNVCGRYEGEEPGLPALILGSHIDTVRNAGKYDGNFGVVAAIEAVAALNRTGFRLPFAIEVVAFGDEEGVRFPVTLTGSRAVAGTFDPTALDVVDNEGVTLREALTRFGCAPAAIRKVARKPECVLGYCELHIEQGPVLEAENLPLGIVTAIAGASRIAVELTGIAGHAGTVPMPLRRDALCAAAEMVLEVERVALEVRDLVATVGLIQALPGATNVIPSDARFTIDVRSPTDTVRERAAAQLSDIFAEIAARRRVGFNLRRTYNELAATCDPDMMRQLEHAVSSANIRPLTLPSGAGHDGLAMVALCPIAMLFVRCAGGISHNPAEAIIAADADVAVRVLGTFLRSFVPRSHR